jgi:hypothetical protein
VTTGPETVLEAVQFLERQGYTANLIVRPDGTIRCGACQRTHPIEGALVDRVFRYEGASDPDDEAIVLGVRCPHCGTKGVVVSAYGPAAEPAVLRQLQFLDERFHDQQR